MKKFNLQSFLYYTLIPLMLAFTISMLIPSYKDVYGSLNKGINVPPVVFVVVWSILYILMGISAYIVDNSGEESIKNSLIIYYVQLFVNLLWPVIFFGFGKIFISLGIIILLLGLVIINFIKFYKINKIAGYLLIPYIAWLVFATYLNYTVYVLNK